MKSFHILLVNIWGLKSYYVYKNVRMIKSRSTKIHHYTQLIPAMERGKGVLCWHTDGFVMDID